MTSLSPIEQVIEALLSGEFVQTVGRLRRDSLNTPADQPECLCIEGGQIAGLLASQPSRANPESPEENSQ